MPLREYPLLSALMAPCEGRDFLKDHWPRRAFAAHGPRERLPAMMREEILGKPATLGQNYVGRVRFTHGGSERMVPIADVPPATLQDMGLTLQFVDIGPCVPGATAFMRQLEAELGLHEGAVTISAFTSPRDDGLSCHYDAAELISVQLYGSKRFHYAPVQELRNPCGSQFTPTGLPFDDLYPQMGDGFPDPSTATFQVAEMRPGSVLFLPRGTWHHTEASDNSLSLSITIDAAPALRCLLDQLRLLLLQDAQWRQPLFGGCGDGIHDEEAREHVTRLLASLPDIIAQLTPDDLLEAPARLERRLQCIGPETRFQRTPHGRLDVAPAKPDGSSTASMRLGHTENLSQLSGHAEIPPRIVPVFRWLEAQRSGPFTGAALQAAFPEEPFATLKSILDLCVKSQFLRLLWFPPLASSTRDKLGAYLTDPAWKSSTRESGKLH